MSEEQRAASSPATLTTNGRDSVLPTPDQIKVAVCEYLLSLNEGCDVPFVPPTAIDWMGNGLVKAVLDLMRRDEVTRIAMRQPRAFVLVRREDVSGVSGTGEVAQGVEFADGTVALRWLSAWPTSVVFHDKGIEAVRAVHGHDGRTEVAFADG